MARERVEFSRGPSATIPTHNLPGRLLVETDTGDVFVDNTLTDRVQLTDTRKFDKAGGTITGDVAVEGELTANNGLNCNNKIIINSDGTISGDVEVLKQWNTVINSDIQWVDY